jgi:hypothetical protein
MKLHNQTLEVFITVTYLRIEIFLGLANGRLELHFGAINSQIHASHLLLEMLANLFNHELLLVNVDLVIIVTKATVYDEPREPFVELKAEAWKQVLAFLDHLKLGRLNALFT